MFALLALTVGLLGVAGIYELGRIGWSWYQQKVSPSTLLHEDDWSGEGNSRR